MHLLELGKLVVDDTQGEARLRDPLCTAMFESTSEDILNFVGVFKHTESERSANLVEW